MISKGELYPRSRILQRKWVSETANDLRRELYFGSCILQGTKGWRRSQILKVTNAGWKEDIYRRKGGVAGLGNCKELKSGVGTAYWTGLWVAGKKEKRCWSSFEKSVWFMKILLLQESDWLKRNPHQQHHLRMKQMSGRWCYECDYKTSQWINENIESYNNASNIQDINLIRKWVRFWIMVVQILHFWKHLMFQSYTTISATMKI